MDLSQIELIVEIANSGSISQAAQNLYMSQPSISKKLKSFERELGVPLFERISSGIRLTPIGRRFVDNAQDIIAQVNNLEEILNKKDAQAIMELNIASISFHFMRFILAELFNRYSHNPISIKYLECGFSDQLELIKNGDIDIGIVTLWQKDRRASIKKANAQGVEYHTINAAKAYIGVSKDSVSYPESVTGLDFERLSKMPIVSISPFSNGKMSGWDYIKRIFSYSKIESSGKEIITNNTGTMKEMTKLADGFAIIVLNDGIYDRYGFFEDMRLIPVPPEMGVQYELGWLQKANTSRAVLANEFIGMMTEYAGSDYFIVPEK